MKAAFDLHIHNEPLLVDEYEVQQSSPPRWLLCHLEEEFMISALQEPPGLFMSCYAVPPACIRVVEVPREDTRACEHETAPFSRGPHPLSSRSGGL